MTTSHKTRSSCNIRYLRSAFCWDRGFSNATGAEEGSIYEQNVVYINHLLVGQTSSSSPKILDTTFARKPQTFLTHTLDNTQPQSTLPQRVMDRKQNLSKPHGGKAEASKQATTPAPSNAPAGQTLQPSSHTHRRNDSNSTNWSTQAVKSRTPEPSNQSSNPNHNESPRNRDRDLKGCGAWDANA